MTTLLDVEPFILTRSFAAPRPLVWKCFTEAGHLARWWGPKGCKVQVAALDLRPGGRFHYSLRFGEADAIWGRFVFREIEPPRRLVFVNSFSDAEGGLTRAPFDGTWPLEMLSTFRFEEAGDGTEVTIRWDPLDEGAAERQTFDAGRASMNQGWSGSLDVLEGYLTEIAGDIR